MTRLNTISELANTEVRITWDVFDIIFYVFGVAPCYIGKTDGNHFNKWAEALQRRVVEVTQNQKISFVPAEALLDDAGAHILIKWRMKRKMQFPKSQISEEILNLFSVRSGRHISADTKVNAFHDRINTCTNIWGYHWMDLQTVN